MIAYLSAVYHVAKQMSKTLAIGGYHHNIRA